MKKIKLTIRRDVLTDDVYMVETCGSNMKVFGVDYYRVIKNLGNNLKCVKVKVNKERNGFDKTKCKVGLLHLRNYKKEFDEKKNRFKDKPFHGHESNGADAFRYLAVGIDEKRFVKKESQHQYALT